MIWYWLMNVDGSVARNGNGEWLVGIMFRYGLCWLLLMSIGRWLRGAEWGNGNGLGVKGLKRDSFQRNCYSFFFSISFSSHVTHHLFFLLALLFSRVPRLCRVPPCGLILSIHSFSYSYYVMIRWRWWRYMIRHYPRHCHCPNLLNRPSTPNSPPPSLSLSLYFFFFLLLFIPFFDLNFSSFLFFFLSVSICVLVKYDCVDYDIPICKTVFSCELLYKQKHFTLHMIELIERLSDWLISLFGEKFIK